MKVSYLSRLARVPVSHDPALAKQVLVAPGAFPPLVQLARVSLAPGESTTPHAHEDLVEVFLVDSGTGRMTIDAKTIPLAPGHCVTVEPGERHALASDASSELVVTYFS